MFPTYEQAMLPVLQALADGQRKDRSTLTAVVSDAFNLTPEERAALLPSGKGTRVQSRTGWALTYLKAAGLVATAKRGIYEITDRGRSVLARNLSALDADMLGEFPEFREFEVRSRGGDSDASSETPAVTTKGRARGAATAAQPTTPEEDLDSAYRQLREAVELELLESVKNNSPAFFEQLVVDLPVQMGYGGTRAEAARAIGKSGDGGIDGVIDQDRLGLDSVYIQAKRWESTVDRPELQKFAGALQGQRATKGVFITTSSFTRDAADYASRINARIVLIDGKRLASLMFEHDVGVAAKQTYVMKGIDGDYFEAGA
jgi:restriction system protein